MHSALIKAALKMHGFTQVDIAKQCNVKPAAVHKILNGLSRSGKIENHIAAVTQLPLAELWPQWHGSNAKPKRRGKPINTKAVVEALRALVG